MEDETPRKWRGVRSIGCQFQVSFDADTQGNPVGGAIVEMRTDLWTFWLEDAIKAVDAACLAASEIPVLVNKLDGAGEQAEPIWLDLDRLMIRELRSTMRAVTACAFALDAFYATIKTRCGPHPQWEQWRDNRTPRKKQVAETFRHHLRVDSNEKARAIKSCVYEVFGFRDKAVHMSVEYRPALYREDIQADVDQHFGMFQCQSAVNAVHSTVVVLDYLVSRLDQGGDELSGYVLIAQERMDQVLRAYGQIERLPEFPRAERA